jgi:hypothetical protein
MEGQAIYSSHMDDTALLEEGGGRRDFLQLGRLHVLVANSIYHSADACIYRRQVISVRLKWISQVLSLRRQRRLCESKKIFYQ